MLSVVLVPSTFTVGTAFNVFNSSQYSVSVCRRGASDLEQGASNRPTCMPPIGRGSSYLSTFASVVMSVPTGGVYRNPSSSKRMMRPCE